ncbi:MAG: hypothetical protein WCX65_12635 [bacterium]
MARELNPIEIMLTRDTDTMWKIMGGVMRNVCSTEIGRKIVSGTGKHVAALLVETGAFGLEKETEPRSIGASFADFLQAIGCGFEVVEGSDDDAVINMLACPYEICDEATCLAVMSIDSEVVKRLGGKLIIEETIAAGADKCRLRVVRQD